MRNLNELIASFSLKHRKKIAKVLEPLARISGLTGCFRYTIQADGQFTFIGSAPEWIQEYYSQGYYINNPFLRHPKLLRPGINFTQTAKDDKYHECMALRRKKVDADHSLLLIEPTMEGVEVFGFYTESQNVGIYNFYFNEMPLLKAFTHHFKDSLKAELAAMHRDPSDLKLAKKGAFFDCADSHDSALSPSARLRFYKEIGMWDGPLDEISFSRREKQLISLLKRGRSASEMGKILSLSPRTVEFYLDKLKTKLLCHKKSQLFDRLELLENIGYK